ncbi:hypothetical protein [Vibrio hippocampi]|uniref:Uncharacterized protein n=1 Tax=Vibrio hippocampi TaxID=654686 RepID=A0ABN8DDT0_9VIBR|nr:hypothetical protein [Vibrio hippocampi]CAH0525130.1 hypothetical protein VHP8226_00796 [Vibrio hippocampi]
MKTLLTLLLMLVFMPVQGTSAEWQHHPLSSQTGLTLFQAATPSDGFTHYKGVTLSLAESESVTPKAPKSKTRFSEEVVAIVNYYRHAYVQRKDLESESDSLEQPYSHPKSAAFTDSTRLNVARWKQTSHHFHYSRSHRISGWKETNALYVALNSQFFS